MGKFIILYTITMLSFVSYKAFAAHTFEVEPGTMEMTSSNPEGFSITEMTEMLDPKTNQKSIYFCVKEVKGKSSRCFYALKNDFRVLRKGLILNAIQYSLKERLSNKAVHTDIKTASFFYKLTIVRPQNS